MQEVQAPRIKYMCLPMLFSRMRKAAQDKVRLTFGVPKLNAPQFVHYILSSYLCAVHARRHRFQDRSHCWTKKLLADGSTREMLRNRDLESAGIIGTLAIIRAVQRRQWFGRNGDLSNFKEDLSLWTRRTWAIVSDRRGEPVCIGRPSSGAKQVLAPKSLRELCTKYGVPVPFQFEVECKPLRRHRGLRI